MKTDSNQFKCYDFMINNLLMTSEKKKETFYSFFFLNKKNRISCHGKINPFGFV